MAEVLKAAGSSPAQVVKSTHVQIPPLILVVLVDVIPLLSWQRLPQVDERLCRLQLHLREGQQQCAGPGARDHLH